MLGIIADLVEIYQEKIRNFLNPNVVKNIINSLMKADPKKYSELVEWATHVIICLF